MCLAIPAKVVAIGEPGTATAEVGGVRRSISLALCPEARVGDWVLVHVGFALGTVDEKEARKTLALVGEAGREWAAKP